MFCLKLFAEILQARVSHTLLIIRAKVFYDLSVSQGISVIRYRRTDGQRRTDDNHVNSSTVTYKYGRLKIVTANFHGNDKANNYCFKGVVDLPCVNRQRP